MYTQKPESFWRTAGSLLKIKMDFRFVFDFESYFWLRQCDQHHSSLSWSLTLMSKPKILITTISLNKGILPDYVPRTRNDSIVNRKMKIKGRIVLLIFAHWSIVLSTSAFESFLISSYIVKERKSSILFQSTGNSAVVASDNATSCPPLPDSSSGDKSLSLRQHVPRLQSCLEEIHIRNASGEKLTREYSRFQRCFSPWLGFHGIDHVVVTLTFNLLCQLQCL